METNNLTEQEREARENAKKIALEKLKQKATIVNIDEIVALEARKAADAYMTEKPGKASIIKKYWKHTLFDEYYRQRQINRVKKQINDKGSIYAGRLDDENSQIAHQNAMLGITERFQAEYEGTLSDGEDKKILNKDNPEAIRVRKEITDLINAYASTKMDDAAFKNAKTRILDSIKDDILNSAKNYADNLFEIAQNARLAIEHGAKMEELDYDLDIIVGKAKSSLKTQAHYNWSDKAVDLIKKTKVGRFVSPAVLSTSVGIAYSLSVGFGLKFVRSKAAAVGSLGASVALSGLFAGMNESQRLAAERAQHELEMAEGNTFAQGDKRREKMDSFRYETVSSTELTGKLTDLMFNKDKDGNLSPKEIKEADVEKTMNLIAQIEARNSLNSKKKIDLISYSSVGSVEKERTDLTILTARAKVELRKRIESDLKNGIPQGEESFDKYLKNKIQVVEDSLLGGEKGISAQDKAFRKFKAKRVAGKVLTTVTVGAIVGATVQEIAALFRDNVDGLLEGLVDKYIHNIDGSNSGSIQTPLAHLADWIKGDPSHLAMGNPNHLGIGENGVITFPEGTNILSNSDGTFNILRGDDVISQNVHLTFNPDGTLDPQSIARLGEDGIIATTEHSVIETTKEVTIPASEYINNHGGDVEVNRIGWYDNDTPKPLFDQNELKLHWGGENGLDSNGNYVFDVSHMTSGGSFTNGLSVDAVEQIKKGALSVIFSLTDGTQDHVFELPIDTDGKVIIDPNSEIGKLFFENENGHAVFKGRFAEVVQSFGEKDGVEQIKSLATVVGDGNDAITETVTDIVDNTDNTLGIPKGVEPAMYIPFYVRSPLEPVTYNKEKILKKLGLVPMDKTASQIKQPEREKKKSKDEIKKAERDAKKIEKLEKKNFKELIKSNSKFETDQGYFIIKKVYKFGFPVVDFIYIDKETGEMGNYHVTVESFRKNFKGNNGKKIDEVPFNFEKNSREPGTKGSVIETEEKIIKIIDNGKWWFSKTEAVIKDKKTGKIELVYIKGRDIKKIISPKVKENKSIEKKKNIAEKIENFKNLIFIGSKIETKDNFYKIVKLNGNKIEVITKDKGTGVYSIESLKLKDLQKDFNSDLVIKSETDFIDFEKDIGNYNKKEIGGVIGLDDYYYKIVKIEKSLLRTSKSFIALEKNINTGEIEIVNLKEEEVDQMLATLEIPGKEDINITEIPEEESKEEEIQVKIRKSDRKIKQKKDKEVKQKVEKESRGIIKWFLGNRKKKVRVEQLPPLDIHNKDFNPVVIPKFKDILKLHTEFVDYKRNKYKIISIENKGQEKWIKMEITDSETGQKKEGYWSKRDLERDFNKNILEVSNYKKEE